MSQHMRDEQSSVSPRRRWLGRPQFSLAALLVAMVPLSVAFAGIRTYLDGRPIAWEEFSQGKLDESLKKERVVLVSLQAEWAIHQRRVLDTPSVRRAIRSQGTVPLSIDVTWPSPKVVVVSKTELQFGSSSGVLICRNNGPPVVLTGMITEQQVLDALKQATRTPPK